MSEVSEAWRRYEAVVADLATIAPAESAKMFGVPCLKVEGKAIAGFFQGTMAFKLTGDAHARALGLSGSRLWDPSGKHRPMKEWVQVTAEHADLWPELARHALAYLKA